VEDGAKLVGIAFVQAVEIMVDHGFDGGTVMTHAFAPVVFVRHSGARASANPESRDY
jgi:hypothetical protein